MARQQKYWDDPYLCEFEAGVTSRTEVGGQPAVVLDATCFYPTSGGQPNDLGTLDAIPVVDVVESADDIVHVLARPLAVDAVHGRIDWTRRFDHMQQHTGQHILSQAFVSELAAETVSFHLGDDTCAIDLDVSVLERDQVVRVEDLANRVVMQNRAVFISEHDASEVPGLGLRKQPDVAGSVRAVHITDFDVCACCGTHVRATGEVGCIHIRRWERRRDQVRVEFLCGWRAAHDYHARDAVLQQVANDLSVAAHEVPDAVSRLRDAEKAARQEATSSRKRLMELEIPHLASMADDVGGYGVVAKLLEGYDAGNMRFFAQSLMQGDGLVCLLAVSDPSPQVCFARSQDVDVDMGKLLRETLAEYGGRGGGQSAIAQGGGVAPDDLPKVLSAARHRLTGSSSL